MKSLPLLSAFIFSFFNYYSSFAQENGSFTFQILDYKGSPIQRAKLIVLNGEEHFAGPEGMITYFGEVDYVKKNGVMVKTRVMPLYITVKAPNYKDRRIDLTQYAIGAFIVVKLDRLDKMSTDYKSISVYVKDRNGKPISGASVMVNPGKATSTDASGYAEALHTILLSGEYVMIEVYKEGYKIQRQYIPSGDAPRIENGKQIPPATAYFTMEKGDNDATIFHINVEVLDFETDEPVPGASVQLEVSDGAIMKGTTNTQGEYRFSDVEYSFKGTTSKVIIKKTGYEEKWSDITSDLMTGKDNPERQFLVYIKKQSTAANWAGTYEGNTSWGVLRIVISGLGNGISATTAHIKTSGYTDKGQWFDCKVEGNKLKCKWTEKFEDGDKSASRNGTVEVTLQGNVLSGTSFENEPSFSWKPNISPYQSGMRAGAAWPLTITKK